MTLPVQLSSHTDRACSSYPVAKQEHKKAPCQKKEDRVFPSSDLKTRKILSSIRLLSETPTLYQKQLFKAIFGKELPSDGKTRILSGCLSKDAGDCVSTTPLSSWKPSHRLSRYILEDIKPSAVLPFRGYLNDYYSRSLSSSPFDGACYMVIGNTCYRLSGKQKNPEVIHTYPATTTLTGIEILNTNTLVVSKKESIVPHLLEISADAKGIKVSEVTFPKVAGVLSKINIIKRINTMEFLTGHHDGAVCHTNTLTGVTTKIAAHNGPICSIVMDESSSKIAVGDNNGFVAVYDRYNDFKRIDHIRPSASGKRAVAWLPGSSSVFLVGGGVDDGEIYIYDMNKKILMYGTELPLQGQITNIVFIDTNVCAVSYGFRDVQEKSKIELFAISDSYKLKIQKITSFCKYEENERILNLEFSKKFRRLFAIVNRLEGEADGELSLYDFTEKSSSVGACTSLLDKLTIK